MAPVEATRLIPAQAVVVIRPNVCRDGADVEGGIGLSSGDYVIERSGHQALSAIRREQT